MFFSIDKYTSGSYNAPTWRKKTPHAKTFAKFKTTIQVTVWEKFLQFSLFSKVACRSPPRKCKIALRTPPTKTRKILSSAEYSERAGSSFACLQTCNFACLTNPWFLVFHHITDMKAKDVPAFKVRSYKKWGLACSTGQSRAETIWARSICPSAWLLVKHLQ